MEDKYSISMYVIISQIPHLILVSIIFIYNSKVKNKFLKIEENEGQSQRILGAVNGSSDLWARLYLAQLEPIFLSQFKLIWTDEREPAHLGLSIRAKSFNLVGRLALFPHFWTWFINLLKNCSFLPHFTNLLKKTTTTIKKNKKNQDGLWTAQLVRPISLKLFW